MASTAFSMALHLEGCLTLLRCNCSKTGSMETESRWVRSGGEPIDVWISGRAIRGTERNHGADALRCPGRHREAQARGGIHEKNQSLAHANAELSRKNRELDEFVYVVSHDLQEPLRTLTAFSDFLLQDHAEQLDSEAQRVRAPAGECVAANAFDDPGPLEPFPCGQDHR